MKIKKGNKILSLIIYAALSCIVILGLMTIVGTSAGAA